jgi:hypothetical protein
MQGSRGNWKSMKRIMMRKGQGSKLTDTSSSRLFRLAPHRLRKTFSGHGNRTSLFAQRILPTPAPADDCTFCLLLERNVSSVICCVLANLPRADFKVDRAYSRTSRVFCRASFDTVAWSLLSIYARRFSAFRVAFSRVFA